MTTEGPLNDKRAAKILAHSLFRDMRHSGYGRRQILALATELIDLVTKDMRGESAPELLPPAPSAALDLRKVG
jgi:hypothetical protein